MLSRGRAGHLEALDRLAEAFAWPRVAEPLVRFALAGPPAPRPRAALARRRPLHVARGLGYRAGRNTLNALGLKDWPNLY